MNVPSAPLRHRLREPFSDADVGGLWNGVVARRERPSRAPWVFAVAAAGALAAAFARRPNSPAPGGPLRLADGSAFAEVHPTAPRTITFADRSAVHLAAGSRLAPRENSASAFTTLLTEGRARFDVTPRGPRRWQVDAGLVTVTVVGTSFAVDRAPDRVSVTVFHGLVRVDGPRVPDRSRLLHAGESLTVTAAPPAENPLPAALPAPSVPPPNTVTPVVARAPRTAAPARARWRELAANDPSAAYDTLGPDGFARTVRAATDEDLDALGSLAHRSRHYPEAAEAFGRLVREHPRSPRAPLAAFTLGRLQAGPLQAPAEAARSFETALRLGLSRDLAEDAWKRLVEAHEAAGDHRAAEATARAYLQQFPDGRHAAFARRWIR